MEDLAELGGDEILGDGDEKKNKKLIKASSKGKALYEEVAINRKEAQKESNAQREAEEQALKAYERKLMFNERRVKEDQPRNLTEDMINNRGLIRKRENIISKVKLRRKHEKMVRQDRLKKGIKLSNNNRDPHALNGVGEAVVRDVKLY